MPPQTPVSMDEDESVAEEPAVPIIRQPTRSLSDENIHLSSATETLKLTDFDVRGTLGSSTQCGQSESVLIRHTRDRNLWEGVARPPQDLFGGRGNIEIFRSKNPPQGCHRPPPTSGTRQRRTVYSYSCAAPFHRRFIRDFPR